MLGMRHENLYWQENNLLIHWKWFIGTKIIQWLADEFVATCWQVWTSEWRQSKRWQDSIKTCWSLLLNLCHIILMYRNSAACHSLQMNPFKGRVWNIPDAHIVWHVLLSSVFLLREGLEHVFIVEDWPTSVIISTGIIIWQLATPTSIRHWWFWPDPSDNACNL